MHFHGLTGDYLAQHSRILVNEQGVARRQQQHIYGGPPTRCLRTRDRVPGHYHQGSEQRLCWRRDKPEQLFGQIPAGQVPVLKRGREDGLTMHNRNVLLWGVCVNSNVRFGPRGATGPIHE